MTDDAAPVLIFLSIIVVFAIFWAIYENLGANKKNISNSTKGRNLKKMSASLSKKKLNEWAKTDEIRPYWEDTFAAREYGESVYLTYIDDDDKLFWKWIKWIESQGYEDYDPDNYQRSDTAKNKDTLSETPIGFYGKRGGRYYERTSKDGRRYKQYY